MNERILELARQSGGIDMTNHVAGGITAWVGTGTPEFLERFAELIVKECIDKITSYDLTPGHSAKWEDIYEIHARLLQDLGDELKEHFGVK